MKLIDMLDPDDAQHFEGGSATALRLAAERSHQAAERARRERETRSPAYMALIDAAIARAHANQREIYVERVDRQRGVVWFNSRAKTQTHAREPGRSS